MLYKIVDGVKVDAPFTLGEKSYVDSLSDFGLKERQRTINYANERFEGCIGYTNGICHIWGGFPYDVYGDVTGLFGSLDTEDTDYDNEWHTGHRNREYATHLYNVNKILLPIKDAEDLGDGNIVKAIHLMKLSRKLLKDSVNVNWNHESCVENHVVLNNRYVYDFALEMKKLLKQDWSALFYEG